MKIAVQERISPMRGEFTLIGKDKEGNIVINYSDKNLIVNNAKVALASLVSNAGAESKIITQIGFGTSSTTPSPNDTTLAAPYKKNVLGYSYPEAGKVRFSWRLEYGEANGKAISEFGLLCADGSLFARKVRGAITKEEDLALEGEWTIIF